MGSSRPSGLGKLANYVIKRFDLFLIFCYHGLAQAPIWSIFRALGWLAYTANIITSWQHFALF
jgi:hypothetical protein